MSLPYLDVFCKVYELKSFSKAALSLYLTQPTISAHIKTLEEELAIKLFDRVARQVTPTRAGDLLYDYARNIETLKQEALEAILNFSGNLKGNLFIGGSTIPGEYILPEKISQFKKECPQVIMTLQIADTSRIANMVIEGDLEIGVVGAKMEDSRLERISFIDDEIIFVANSDYPDNFLPIDIIGNMPLITRERGSGSRTSVETALTDLGIDINNLNIVAEIGSTEAVKRAVKAGLGLSALSTFAVKDELANGTLKALEVKGFPIKRSLHIITHSMKAKSPICRAFLDYLKTSSPM